MLVDVKQMALNIKNECKEHLAKLSYSPYLMIVQVEGDAASDSYTKGKRADCAEVGLKCVHKLLPGNSSFGDVYDTITDGNLDEHCIGIILQLPLPKHLVPYQGALIDHIDILKDVDGFRAESPFKPCTPAGIMEIIKHWTGTNDLSDTTVLVIGRGKLVGAPLYDMLNKENATIIQANSHTTRDTLRELCRVADIIVTATGHRNTLDETMLQPGYAGLIVDAGITRGDDGKLYGDCDKALYYAARAEITPVPGGVGLMTRAMLIKNCVDSTEV